MPVRSFCAPALPRMTLGLMHGGFSEAKSPPGKRRLSIGLHSSEKGAVDRIEKQQGLIGQADKPEALVLGGSLRIFGINEEADAACLRMNPLCPDHGVHQQTLPQTLILKFDIYRQTSKTYTGDAMREPASIVWWKMDALQLRQAQGVESANPLGLPLLNGHEGSGQTLVPMLAGETPQPVIQFRLAAIESLAIMAVGQSLQPHQRSRLEDNLAGPTVGPGLGPVGHPTDLAGSPSHARTGG